MKISLKSIYWEFFLLGIQLLGGGYVIIPLIQKNLIEKKNWITQEELTDFYALSQTIPGILAANISTFVGYKLRGKIGAFIALTGIITSPIISILLIASIVDFLLKISYIQNIFWGVGIAVIILIFLSIKEIWTNSVYDITTWIIFLTTCFLSLFLKISPVLLIIGSIIFGVMFKLAQKRCEK
ncbi:chromate transporter [bacterium]|nr:chromate transporter [bacterium]